MQAFEHLLFFGRKRRSGAVQKESRFVQQALGRFHALDDYAAGEHVEMGIFFGREFLTGEDNDGQISERGNVADALEHIESRHIRQTEIEDHAVNTARLEKIESV